MHVSLTLIQVFSITVNTLPSFHFLPDWENGAQAYADYVSAVPKLDSASLPFALLIVTHENLYLLHKSPQFDVRFDQLRCFIQIQPRGIDGQIIIFDVMPLVSGEILVDRKSVV